MFNNFFATIIYDKGVFSWKCRFLCVCLLQMRQNVAKSIFYARGSICCAGGNISYNVKTAWQQQNKFVLEPNFSRFLSARLYATDKGIFFLLYSAHWRKSKKGIDFSNKWAIFVNIKRCEKSSFLWRHPLQAWEIDKSTLTFLQFNIGKSYKWHMLRAFKI